MVSARFYGSFYTSWHSLQMKVDFNQIWVNGETGPRAQVFESWRFSLSPGLKVYVTIAFTFILLWAVIIFGFIYPCLWRKARQYFISSCYIFLEEKTLSKYFFTLGWIYPRFNQSGPDAWMIPSDTKLYLYWISPRWVNTVTGDETGLFRPYLRRLECPTILRYHNKGSTFSSVILRPRVLVRPGFELATSRPAGRRLSNWANRAVV